MPEPLLTAAEMRAQDRLAIQQVGIPGPVLMEVAGRAVADAAKKRLGAGGGAVCIVCGKGNNGGDGLVAARHLSERGVATRIYLLAEPERLSADARLQADICRRLGHSLTVIEQEEKWSAADFAPSDLIIDAIFGTGLSAEVRGPAAAAIEKINASARPVIAVDVPSGIDSDTGRVMGVAVRATETVTFAYLKPGLMLFPGAAHAGQVTLVDIGIPRSLLGRRPGGCWLWTAADTARIVRPRPADAHKGHFGHLVVLAGSREKPGAAALCCRAAVRGGAGLVTLAAPDEVLARAVCGAVEFMGQEVQDAAALEAVCRGKQALVIGPGLGTGERQRRLILEALERIPLPAVIDADGLNNLAGEVEKLSARQGGQVLTPHPGEAARLLGVSTREIQRDRLAAARELARRSGSVAVLKGARTVVARADGTVYVITGGNPGMATGGTGDVLTGVIGALVAQGVGLVEAAGVGVAVHAQAGDRAAESVGEHALCASDLIEALGPVLRGYESQQRAQG